MVILLAGATHTGKTRMAQKLLERYGYPYLSLDHLKMGLIRSGYTRLTPEDDRELMDYLWPVVREMVKTVLENRQNLVVEGGYIPFDWRNSFSPEEQREIQYLCLVMSEGYIRTHMDQILGHANVIETRKDDSDCTMERLLEENRANLEQCRRYGERYQLIDRAYPDELDL